MRRPRSTRDWTAIIAVATVLAVAVQILLLLVQGPRAMPGRVLLSGPGRQRGLREGVEQGTGEKTGTRNEAETEADGSRLQARSVVVHLALPSGAVLEVREDGAP